MKPPRNILASSSNSIKYEPLRRTPNPRGDSRKRCLHPSHCLLVFSAMRVGTKSLLWGVHAFWLHPIYVGRAWRALFVKWPTFNQWVCIAAHDIGYWGCKNLDGPEGKLHPEAGARIASWLIYRIERYVRSNLQAFFIARDAYTFAACHSSSYAAQIGLAPSPLYYADKASVLYEARWLYLLRAKASGEIWEYIQVALASKVWSDEFREYFERQPRKVQSRLWFNWYREKTRLRIQNAKL